MLQIISAFILSFSMTAAGMEKMNQGDWSILATELHANKSISLYLLPFSDLKAEEFSLDLSFFKDERFLRFNLDNKKLLSSTMVEGRVETADISGSNFVMEGPVIRVDYDLAQNDELWTLLNLGKFGQLKFKHNENSSAYLERNYYRFESVTSLKSLNKDKLQELNQLSSKTTKLPISILMTSIFDLNKPHHINVFLQNLKSGVDSYWKKQCNIELEFKQVRSFETNDKASYAFVPDLNPEYFIMESWFHGEKNAIPVVSGKSAAGASGVAMMKMAWNVRNVHEMMSRTQHPNMVLFSHETAGKEDANTLAHELGHILLQTGHSDDPTNLMAAGGRGASKLPGKLTSKQCKQAKKFLQEHFN